MKKILSTIICFFPILTLSDTQKNFKIYRDVIHNSVMADLNDEMILKINECCDVLNTVKNKILDYVKYKNIPNEDPYATFDVTLNNLYVSTLEDFLYELDGTVYKKANYIISKEQLESGENGFSNHKISCNVKYLYSGDPSPIHDSTFFIDISYIYTQDHKNALVENELTVKMSSKYSDNDNPVEINDDISNVSKNCSII